MAGFFNNNGQMGARNPLNKINSNYDGLLIKNSQAIGYIEGELKRRTGSGYGDNYMDATIALSDTTSRYRTKTLAFFQLDYDVKVEKLRDMAANSEIDFVLDNISNDVIVYDEHNRFCYPADLRKALKSRPGVRSLKDQYINEEQLMDSYLDTFDDIYSAWGFDNGISAWKFFYQYLIEGRLAFEIIYDDVNKPTKIIGFKELNAGTLYPIVQQESNGDAILSWMQRDVTTNGFKTLSDNQIIYLQYSTHHKTKRISFVESMVRSFNVLRLVEYSKVLWHLMYSAIRLNTKVPIGTKTIDRAREEVREYLNLFKEDIHFNQDTGEMLVDGQPKLHYYKNYVTPVNKSGEGISVEPMSFDGPDLQDSQLLNYFFKKLKLDSKLPFSRWDYNEGGGSYLLGPDSVSREEITYGKFISRLRTGFSEIITKPVYIQMCLNNEVLKKNARIRNMIGIKYNDDKLLERIKMAEIHEKGAKTVSSLYELKEKEENSYFDLDFLVKKYMDVNEEDIAENQKYKDTKKFKGVDNAFGAPGESKSDDFGSDGDKSQSDSGSETQSQSDTDNNTSNESGSI